jgi:hypothetical protein
VNEPLSQEMLDVLEDRLARMHEHHKGNPMPPGLGAPVSKWNSTDAWFKNGAYGIQCGYEPHTDLYLESDDVPLFLRAMYNQYAVDMMPAQGYIFAEHPFSGLYSFDKTFEEAAFLERVRMMLVMEEGQSLWLARATPRAWLNQGQKIGVTSAPTFFGTLAYEIVSDVGNGKITATVQIPSRDAPKSVFLRFRHPKASPIKSVEVNGKPSTDFDKDKEYIRLQGLTGTVAVQANY